jgi:hypothetical protein
MDGKYFIHRIKRLGRERGIVVRFEPAMGKAAMADSGMATDSLVSRTTAKKSVKGCLRQC